MVAAEHTFEESAGLTLTFGQESVEVTYPGPAHSQDNVVVYLPARRILFGGCTGGPEVIENTHRLVRAARAAGSTPP